MGPDVIQEAEKKADLEIQPNDIVLFYTGHYNRYYPKPEYLEGYSGFSYEAAEYLIEGRRERVKTGGWTTLARTVRQRPPIPYICTIGKRTSRIWRICVIWIRWRGNGLLFLVYLCGFEGEAGPPFVPSLSWMKDETGHSKKDEGRSALWVGRY